MCGGGDHHLFDCLLKWLFVSFDCPKKDVKRESRIHKKRSIWLLFKQSWNQIRAVREAQDAFSSYFVNVLFGGER